MQICANVKHRSSFNKDKIVLYCTIKTNIFYNEIKLKRSSGKTKG